MNLFGRLLRKELGQLTYFVLRKLFVSQERDATARTRLYEAMYKNLNTIDSERMLQMRQRLNETIFESFQINRSYVLVFFVYLLAWFFLMALGLTPGLLIRALIALSVLFVWKTLQYLSNRMAYMDTRLVEIYREVMDKILKSRNVELGQE